MSETIHPLSDFPAPELGAPVPYVVGSESGLGVLYFVADPKDRLASVRFEGIYAMRWGPPNDERRAELPLQPEIPCEVRNSSWLAALLQEGTLDGTGAFPWQMALRHFRLPFHDSTLDVAAAGYKVQIRHSVPADELPALARQLLE